MDPYKKVRPGDDVSFSAAAWNAVLDAARAARGGRPDLAGGGLTTARDAAVVRVKNASGSALARNSVLGLDGPVFTPDGSEDAFLREVAFRGVTPTAGHLGKFCVLLEPAPADRVVRAYVAGVCPVMVNVLDADDARADVDAGSAARLVSSTDGSAQILWREGDVPYSGLDTGPQWALVRLGAGPARDWLALAVTTSTITAAVFGGADGSGTCTITYADGSTATVTVGNRGTASIASGKNAMLGWIPNKNKYYIWGDC